MSPQWNRTYTVVAICITVAFVSLIAAFVISVSVGVDADVLLRFIAGPTIGNILSAAVLAYGGIMSVKLKKLQTQNTQLQESVRQVEKQTNGHMTELIQKIPRRQEIARIIHERTYTDDAGIAHPTNDDSFKQARSKPVPERTRHGGKHPNRSKRQNGRR